MASLTDEDVRQAIVDTGLLKGADYQKTKNALANMTGPNVEPREAEIIVFRYVGTGASAEEFQKLLFEAGISLIRRPANGAAKAISSAESDLWDYPDHRDETKDGASVVPAITKVKNVTALTKVRLHALEITYLPEPPQHYPFSYVVGFHFVCEAGCLANVHSQAELLEALAQATTEVKRFTNDVTRDEFRPVFWFLNGIPPELQGIRGVPSSIHASSGGNACVERGFPQASYITYGILPTKAGLQRIADLGLVAVVPHLVERRHRRRLSEINAAIVDTSDTLFDPAATSPTGASADPAQMKLASEPTGATRLTVEQLRQRLSQVAGAQHVIAMQMKEFYATRTTLIRLRGLVQRVRQLGGGSAKPTLVDLVCDDAMTVIGDEVSMSQELVDNGLRLVGDRLNTTYGELHDKHDIVTSGHSRGLQRIGVILQSSVIAVLSVQILNALLGPVQPRIAATGASAPGLPPPMPSGAPLGLVSTFAQDNRVLLYLLVPVVAFFVGFLVTNLFVRSIVNSK